MTTPQGHENAVAFCCDQNYFHLALFMIWQIAHHNPHRRFDFVISSQDDLQLPDWAKPYGIVLHRAGVLPESAGAARFHGSMATTLRIMLARELGNRYRRIIYLDCDMFVEGGDLNRVFEMDIGDHPVACALDAPCFYVANYHAPEFVAANLPVAAYANTGFQLIDTKAYCEQDVDRRSLDFCVSHPKAIFLGDQSLTNLALRGGFAQLAPCWNWQLNYRYPLVSLRYPVFFNHFIGRRKPNVYPNANLPARFNQAYRDFLTQFASEQLSKLAPAYDPAPMSLREASTIVFDHVRSSAIFAEILARFPDPYRALI